MLVINNKKKVKLGSQTLSLFVVPTAFARTTVHDNVLPSFLLYVTAIENIVYLPIFQYPDYPDTHTLALP